jgi:magnesium chelatase subunit I
MLGKLELEYGGGDASESEILERLVRRATKVVFDERVSIEDLKPLIRSFEDGWKVEVGPAVPSSEYVEGLENIAGLGDSVRKLGFGTAPGRVASAVEFLLEGLHLSNRLNKDVQGRRILFRG